MTEFDNDELIAPNWMNEGFFEHVLRECEKDDSISVTTLKITPATVKGDHFASVMFRATIEYSAEKSDSNLISLIIKTMPELDGNKKEMFGDSHIFETEIGMYSKTIPEFEAELRQVGDDTALGVRALYYSLEPRQIIILEDIVPKGYEMLRHRSVNMEEAKAVLLKLAKWHAVSYKLAAEGDRSVSKYKESFFNMKDADSLPFLTTGMENFIDKIQTIDELKSYVPHLRLLEKKLVKKCIESFSSYRQDNPEGVFVLCHGDFHGKNMMFKTNHKNEFEDVMLIDFQVCYFGPAVLDILYALFMLVSIDQHKNHRDELIYYYCSNFIETLEKLNFQGKFPKIADFYIDILRHRYFELFLLAAFLPLWLKFADKTVGIDDIMSSNNVRRKLYDNPDYVEEVKRLLPEMMHRGYLEKY